MWITVPLLLLALALSSTLPIMQRQGDRYSTPRIAFVGEWEGFSRADFARAAPEELAAKYKLSWLGHAVAQDAYFVKYHPRFGSLVLRQLYFQPSSVGEGVCEIHSPIIPLRDTFVFPLGWRLVRTQLARGEGYLGSPVRYAMLNAGPSTPQPAPDRACQAFRDFDNTFIAADQHQAKMLAHLTRALVGPGRALATLPVTCGYIGPVGPGGAQRCDGREVLARLEPKWLRGMGNWDVPSSPNFTVLRFEPPRAGPIPETFLVFAKVHPNPASGTDPLVDSVRVVRDCSC
jgi:hypothetical protein